MAHHALTDPKTETPPGVWFWNFVIFGGLLLVLLFFMGIFGLPVFGAILLFTQSFWLIEVGGLEAQVVLNDFTRNRRALFQGLNLVLPWEKPSGALIKLQSEAVEIVNQTYATASTNAGGEGGGEMKVRYVLTLMPDYSGYSPGDNILEYTRIDLHGIMTNARKMASTMLSDYYGRNMARNLRNKERINRAVFGTEHRPNPKVVAFAKKYRVIVEVGVEDSDYPEEVQKLHNKYEGIKTAREMIDALMASDGMSKEAAENFVRLYMLPNVTEENINFNIDAPDLKNLTSVNIAPGALGGRTGKRTPSKKN